MYFIRKRKKTSIEIDTKEFRRQFEKYKIVKAKELIKKGLCLPSSFDLRIGDLKRIVKILDV